MLLGSAACGGDAGQLFRLVKLGGASQYIPNFQSGMPLFEGTLTDGDIGIRPFGNDEKREFQKANSVGDLFP
jgi:hypothetical protein